MINWLAAHPEIAITFALVLLYIARSAMPRRPNPEWPRWALVLWEIEARALALPWDRWLGRPKLPGRLHPSFMRRLDRNGWSIDELPTRKEGR
jgi:hypothetical protein